MAWIIDGLLERIGLSKPNSIGYAYGGGGAKGFSHIGVLQAFEKFGIRPNIQSGVSAGSIAAVLYASGLTPLDMIECFSAATKLTDFTEWVMPRQGLMKLNRFAKLLESWLSVKYLEELNIPTVVCATDFDHGKSTGWVKGEIVPRVMASCSIPIVFQPYKINGIHYVDGGVLRNLPAWAIRNYCKTLYGFNCSPLNDSYKFKSSIVEIAMRSYQLMSKSNSLPDINLCDYVVQTSQITSLGTFQLSALKKAVTLGYDSACHVLEQSLNKNI